MVVPLIVLGTVTKLAFAVAVTFRTRTYWVPGTVAVGLGVAGASHPGMLRAAGISSIVLGVAALGVARCLRSSRIALVARSSRRAAG